MVEDVLRTSAVDILWHYIEDHMGTSFGDVLRMSLGRNFTEWEFSIVRDSNNWSIKKLRCYESIKKKFSLFKF